MALRRFFDLTYCIGTIVVNGCYLLIQTEGTVHLVNNTDFAVHKIIANLTKNALYTKLFFCVSPNPNGVPGCRYTTIIEGPIGNQRDFKTAFFKESKVKVGEGVAILNETYYTK